MTNIASENDHWNSGFSHDGHFPKAMLVITRIFDTILFKYTIVDHFWRTFLVKCQLSDSCFQPRRTPSPLRTTRAALQPHCVRCCNVGLIEPSLVAKRSKMWWPARKEFRLHTVCPNLLRKRPSNNGASIVSSLVLRSHIPRHRMTIDPYILHLGWLNMTKQRRSQQLRLHRAVLPGSGGGQAKSPRAYQRSKYNRSKRPFYRHSQTISI